MEFPLRSLASFLGAFAVTWIAVVAVRIFGFGAYEAKWSPGFNLALDSGALLLLLPIAALSFSLGSYLVNIEHDPWARSLGAGVFVALLLAAAMYASRFVESDAIGLTMVWGTLCLAPALFGALARGPWFSSRTGLTMCCSGRRGHRSFQPTSAARRR